nr:DUF2971 domain-containing protein [uncultured Schaedlerella sp.]
MHKWTYSESAQKMANDKIEQLQIFKTPKKSLYHYTSREVFWLIMESESFLARHIMFSNDYEENMIGKKKIAQAMEQMKSLLTEPESLPFMVCFCEEGDLLSQWRGYAREGVAMEFDFSKGLYGLEDGFSSYYCYTIMNQDCDTNYISKNINDEEVVVKAIASPYSVIYTESGEKIDNNIEEKIKYIVEDTENNRQQNVVGMIPYIKNNKFAEEKEYRLIFDMKQIIPEVQRDLLRQKYIYLDVNGIKKPNIRIKFGDQSLAEQENMINLYYINPDWTKILEELKRELLSEKIKIQLVTDKDKYKMPNDEILVSNGKYQEKVCVSLRLKMRQQTPPVRSVKVWCEGHLPLRRIIVGPSQDAELMKCSIEEYLKTQYWTRDIMVEKSVIPLRT